MTVMAIPSFFHPIFYLFLPNIFLNFFITFTPNTIPSKISHTRVECSHHGICLVGSWFQRSKKFLV